MFNLRNLSRFIVNPVTPLRTVPTFQPKPFSSSFQAFTKISFAPIQPTFVKFYTTEVQATPAGLMIFTYTLNNSHTETENNITTPEPSKSKRWITPRLVAIPRCNNLICKPFMTFLRWNNSRRLFKSYRKRVWFSS
jgi:hypothetical protein